MGLNEQKGNMYGFVSHTWNAIKGRCFHDCVYCYMKIFKLKPVRFDEKEMNTNLGEGNFIFVGSSNDMFAPNIPREWTSKVLEHCRKYKNKYLFQSKNPRAFLRFADEFPEDTLLATTIESNRAYKISKAPTPKDRYLAMMKVKEKFPIMVTIEPVLDFDYEVLIKWMMDLDPKWINVGADSKNHNLTEPTKDKLSKLITELQRKSNIKLKNNVHRLLR